MNLIITSNNDIGKGCSGYVSSNLTLIMLEKVSSAKFSSVSNFQSAPIFFKLGEYAALVPSSLGPDETPS